VRASPSAIVRDLGLASLSGLVMLLAFPPFDLAALAWIGLVPLLLACRSPRSAFLLSGLTGIVFFVGIFSWIWNVPAFNLLDGLLVAVYLGLYFALWGLGVAWIRSRTGLPLSIAAAPLWVALEYVRGHVGFLSLPWMLLGYSQYQATALIQVTSLTGVYGLSFLIVLTNASLAEACGCFLIRSGRSPAPLTWTSRPVALPVTALVLIATLVHGHAVLSGPGLTDRIRIAVVQGNVPQPLKWDTGYRQATLDRYAQLTRQVAGHSPALIVWPETAVPGDVQHDPDLRRLIGQLAVETGTHLLVGSSEQAKFARRELHGKLYNSLVLVTPQGGVAAEYRKVRLVPFGEYEPLHGLVKWPRAIAPAVGKSVAGTEYSLLQVGDVTFGATICWENLFPDLVREFVKAGARFMVNSTNEAWFGETSASAQFLAINALRAAENRVAIARATNTGISAFIDPFGRITERLRGADGRELFVEGHIVGEVSLSIGTTPYTRYGDLFAFLQIGGSGLLLICATAARGAPYRSVTHQRAAAFGRGAEVS
jgi:apolipoprotein N-acyltransferase